MYDQNAGLGEAMALSGAQAQGRKAAIDAAVRAAQTVSEYHGQLANNFAIAHPDRAAIASSIADAFRLYAQALGQQK